MNIMNKPKRYWPSRGKMAPVLRKKWSFHGGALKKTVVGSLIGVTALMAVAAFTLRQAIACELLPVLEYQQINGEVFVQPGMSVAQTDALTGLISSASERIEGVYGLPVSKPRMLVAADAEMAAKWGSNEVGAMHRIP